MNSFKTPFWYISFLNCGRWSAPFVLQFSHAQRHEVVPSSWHSSGLREHPIANGEDVGWIHFLKRDVHKCNKRFLDSKKECILSIALLEFVSHNSNSSTLPMSRIIFFDFFTSSRTREFSACFTTACGNPDTLKSMSISSRCVNKPIDCSRPTGRPVLTWSASTFSSAS